jgi:hypothetical protein
MRTTVEVLFFVALLGGCASMGLEYSYPPRPGQSAESYAADKAECEATRFPGGWRRGVQAALWAIDPFGAAVGSAGAAHSCMAKKGYTYQPRHAWE